MWQFQRSRKKKADSVLKQNLVIPKHLQSQCALLFHLWMQEWSAAFPAEMKENHCQPHLSIKRQEKACSNSTWLISCKFFKGLKRALSTWKVWLISSILQFTTVQLINKMLAHLVRRSNLSTGMNTKSLVLMRWLIRAVPWKTAMMLWSLIKANYWSVNVSETLLLLW